MRKVWALAVVLTTIGAPVAHAAKPLSRYVETRMGTEEGSADFGTGGGAGATYPGAVAPFGAVQFSPDTSPDIGNFAGGYTYSDKQIKGFSLTHVSGAGCANLEDVPILPTTQTVDASPSVLGSFDVTPKYLQSFTHTGEVARPGDYRVALGDGTKTELTATPRTGAVRLTFPAGKKGSVLFNAGGSSMGNFDAGLHVDPARHEISGTVSSGAFCSAQDKYRLYFVARFDQPFAASGTWNKALLTPGGTDTHDTSLGPQVGIVTLQYKRVAGLPDSLPGDPTTGAQAGAYATFDKQQVVANVGVSTVSVDGARKNLDAETAPSFDAERRAAQQRWEKRLDAARVTGGTVRQKRVFYSSLYHSLLMPNIMSDVDGSYRGFDDQVHKANGFVKYGNISGWDTYRAQMPLMSMLAPRTASDFVRSMLADYDQSGHLPKWALLEGHTNVMVGDPADLLIAGARAFGATRFDGKAALHAMVDGATHYGVSPNAGYIQRAGLDDYLAKGYVPYEHNTTTIGQTVDPTGVWGVASTTLEYATADFGISRLAAALGDTQTCRTFATRGENWRNVFDPSIDQVRPRRADGTFVAGPDDNDDGFVEGSGAQYLWAVPQNVAGLADALGGRTKALARLDTFLSQLNTGVQSEHAFLGNEPTLHTPYLYDWLGAPSRGAAAVRKALLTLYKATPGGFPGNDDAGSMSAWVVYAALGFYPASAGTDTLAIGSPLFRRAQLKLAHGTLDIRAPRAAAGRPYVHAASFGGKPLRRAWLSYNDIAHGGELRFDLSANPQQTWATKPAAAPPSFAGPAACG